MSWLILSIVVSIVFIVAVLFSCLSLSLATFQSTQAVYGQSRPLDDNFGSSQTMQPMEMDLLYRESGPLGDDAEAVCLSASIGSGKRGGGARGPKPPSE